MNMGANGSTPRLKRKSSPGDVSDSGSRKSRSSDGSSKTPPVLPKENGRENSRVGRKDDTEAKEISKDDKRRKTTVKEDKTGKDNSKEDSKAKDKKISTAKERRNMFGLKKVSAPMANIDSDSEEGAQSYLESADEIEFHTPPPIRRFSSNYKEVKEINKGLEALNDVNRDTKDSKMFNDLKSFKPPSMLQVEKALSLDNNLTRFARGT